MKNNNLISYIFIFSISILCDNVSGEVFKQKNKHESAPLNFEETINRYNTSWGWSFSVKSLHSDDNKDYIEHHLTALKEKKSIVLWKSFRALTLLKYISFEEYGIAFFEHPLIRPFGNIILGFRITPNDIPELCFISPYSPSVPLSYAIIELKEKNNKIKGKLEMKGEDLEHSTIINFEVSKKTIPVKFSSSSIDG